MNFLDVSGKRYPLLRLLGKGKGGYSYLSHWQGKNVVVKQIHHEPCDYYTFGDKLQSELRDYRTLSEVGIPMPRLLEVDEGNERIVKEFIDGPTVWQLVLEDRLPESCWEQVRRMCGLLYPAGLNIDYFPTNFVLEQGKLYYIDYECNGYMEQWDFEHWGQKYWKKSPEFLEYAREHSL